MFSYASQLTKVLIGIHIMFALNAYGKCGDKPEIIAVIDTGFGFAGYGKEAKLCSTGHKDFSGEVIVAEKGVFTPGVPIDLLGHGTNIVGIIESYVRPAHINYCILVLKYYSVKGDKNNLQATVLSIREAIKLGAKYINYSSGGADPYKKEQIEVERFLDGGGIFVTAAVNDGLDLDAPGNHRYPPNYDKRIVVVGMLEKDGNKAKMSNYGSVVNRWEVGRSVLGYQVIQSGTSQATAVATGKIVAKSNNKCDIGK